MYKIEIRYTIYENRNGLLIHPESHWDSRDTMFNSYGYDTQEKALEAILEELHASNYLVVLPVAHKYWD